MILRVCPARLRKLRGRRRSRTPRLLRGRALLSRQPWLLASSSSAVVGAKPQVLRRDECFGRRNCTTSCYGRRLTKSRLLMNQRLLRAGEEFWIRTNALVLPRILFACMPNAIVASRRKKEDSNPMPLVEAHIVFETSLTPGQSLFRGRQ